jgi:hypothetical protein
MGPYVYSEPVSCDGLLMARSVLASAGRDSDDL